MKPEEAIHRRAVSELRRHFFGLGYAEGAEPFFHCPNESKVPPRYRAKLAALGLSSGVSDLVIVHPTVDGHPGAALELKAGRNKASDEQKAWLSYFGRAGFAVAVTTGHVETATQLMRWGYLSAERWAMWIERGR